MDSHGVPSVTIVEIATAVVTMDAVNHPNKFVIYCPTGSTSDPGRNPV